MNSDDFLEEGPHPVEAFVARAVFGARGEAWVKFRQDVQERYSRRVREAIDAAADDLGTTAAQLLEDAAGDERLSDLLVRTVESASRARWRAKARTLGKVLAQGFGADRGTMVDDSDLIMTIVEDLEPPHARALALMEAVGRPFNPGEHGGLAGWLRHHLPELGRVADQVEATLTRHGLVATPFYPNGNLSLTPLGTEMLRLLREAEREPNADLPGPAGE